MSFQPHSLHLCIKGQRKHTVMAVTKSDPKHLLLPKRRAMVMHALVALLAVGMPPTDKGRVRLVNVRAVCLSNRQADFHMEIHCLPASDITPAALGMAFGAQDYTIHHAEACEVEGELETCLEHILYGPDHDDEVLTVYWHTPPQQPPQAGPWDPRR